MKVHIEGNLFLESDERQFIIKEYSGKMDGTGKEMFKSLGYYPTIEQALKGFVNMKIKQSTASTLSELIQDVKRIELYIKSKLS